MRKQWILLFCVAWFVFVGGSEKPKSLFRFHVQTMQQAPKETLIPIHLSDPPSVFFVRKQPDLDERHMSEIQMMEDGSVLVIFNEQGQRKLANLTQGNLGSFLVVISNGRVVYAPIIDVVMGDGQFVIPGGMSPNEVTKINKAIQNPSPVAAPRSIRRNVR